MIVGCDFHPQWQQVAIFDPASGEIVERKLVNVAARPRSFTAAYRYLRWWAWRVVAAVSGS